MRAELTAEAPFTVSPAESTMSEGQQITVSVTLPSTAAVGNYNKKIKIKGSRLGLFPRDQGEVSLSAAVVSTPDFQIEAKDNGNGLIGSGVTRA